MADFPIFKQIDINGRPVPFVYPQHKAKDGYKETGYNNPLPTSDESLLDKLDELKTLIDQQQEETKNVEITNTPTDYPDSAVLEELQAMKEDITATKQTQADILEKLEGTLNTNVTGSNVEDENAIPVRTTNEVIQVLYENSNINELLTKDSFLLNNGDVDNLDIRKTKVRSLVIFNRHDVKINVNVVFKVSGSANSVSGTEVFNGSLPSAGRLEINSLDYPEIDLTYPFLRVRVYRSEEAPTKDVVRSYIYGGAI